MIAVPARHRYQVLPVVQVTRETEDAVSIAFDAPDELTTTYSYRPGQFVTLKVDVDGESRYRSYSTRST
jgi:ring-1,2-phenylacetyl-CoA epoxidase subunit PaaE